MWVLAGNMCCVVDAGRGEYLHGLMADQLHNTRVPPTAVLVHIDSSFLTIEE